LWIISADRRSGPDIWIHKLKRPTAALSAMLVTATSESQSSMVVLPQTYYGTNQRTTVDCFAISERRLRRISGREDTTLRQLTDLAQQKNLPSPHCNAPDSESRAHRIFAVAVRLSLVL
jgi:hypothetical protein